jgi:hypothetical protein
VTFEPTISEDRLELMHEANMGKMTQCLCNEANRRWKAHDKDSHGAYCAKAALPPSDDKRIVSEIDRELRKWSR